MGYGGSPGIDLIDLSGHVLRNISESDLYHHNRVIFYSPEKSFFIYGVLILSHFRHLSPRECLNPLVLFLVKLFCFAHGRRNSSVGRARDSC